MTLETIFFTQVLSIVGFIIALFVLYRVLVSAKDATIEMLKQKISLNEIKLDELSNQDPDILLQRYSRKIEALEKELSDKESKDSESIKHIKLHKEEAEKRIAELTKYQEELEANIIKTRKTAQKYRQHLLDLYNNSCQVCGINDKSLLELSHIQPLSQEGASSISNMLLLCSNHHRLLDAGQFAINNDYSLIGISGSLTVKNEHNLSNKSLCWHREHIYKNQKSTY